MTGFPTALVATYRDSVGSVVAGLTGWLVATPNARTAPAA